MCLVVLDTTIKVADKPIVVYKRLYCNRSSFLLDYKYSLRKLNPQVDITCKITRRGDTIVEEGYHSKNDAEDYNYVFIIPKDTRYIDGFQNDTTVRNRVSSTIICAGRKGNLFTWLWVKWYLFKNK